MKCLRTHFVGPTPTHGARIVADDGDGNRVNIGWNYGVEDLQNHLDAKDALCRKLKWVGETVCGVYRNEYFHVFTGLRAVE